MNGEVYCILLCCPPEERVAALAREMKKDGIGGDLIGRMTDDERDDVRKEFADYIFKHFDLVPAGTAGPLVTAIAKHARASGR